MTSYGLSVKFAKVEHCKTKPEYWQRLVLGTNQTEANATKRRIMNEESIQSIPRGCFPTCVILSLTRGDDPIWLTLGWFNHRHQIPITHPSVTGGGSQGWELFATGAGRHGVIGCSWMFQFWVLLVDMSIHWNIGCWLLVDTSGSHWLLVEMWFQTGYTLFNPFWPHVMFRKIHGSKVQVPRWRTFVQTFGMTIAL